MQRYNQKFSDLTTLNILWSVSKQVFPATLQDYACQLIIDQYEQEGNTIEVPYLQFTNSKSGALFVVEIDDYNQPNSALHVLQVNEKEVDKLTSELKEAIQIILITQVKGYKKEQMSIKVLQTVDGDLAYPSDEDIGMDILDIDSGNDQSEDGGSDSDGAVDLTRENADRVKAELIHIFSDLQNCKKKVKDIRLVLKKIGFNVPDSRLKSLIEDVCTVDKAKGYIIKPQFMDEGTRQKLAIQEQRMYEEQERIRQANKSQKSTKRRAKIVKKQKEPTASLPSVVSKEDELKQLESVKLTKEEGFRIKRQIQIQRFEQGLPPLSIEQFTVELKRRTLLLRKAKK